MALKVPSFNSTHNVFETTSDFHKSDENHPSHKLTIKQCRFRRDEFVNNNEKEKALIGGTLGTILPMLFFAKKQKTSLLKLNYGFKEIASMAVGANLGAISVASLKTKKEHKKQKLHEGLFQVLNSIIPLAAVDGALKLCKKVPQLNNTVSRIGASVLGVVAGSYTGIKLTNKITDPKDLKPDRKYSVKDSIANIDDLASILILAKLPFAKKIQAEKILPVVYTYSGYRSGTSS